MAALNWAMLTPEGRPIPLPAEKFLFASTATVDLSLFPHPPGSPPNLQPPRGAIYHRAARGTLYLSQKRVVYVAPSSSTTRISTDESVPPPPALRSLSVPLRAFVDGRLVQPWFSATYYEALCLSDDPAGGIEGPHLVRLYFKEGGGYDFYTAVEEVKARAELASDRRGGVPVEPLPAYEPAPASSLGPASTSLPSSSSRPPVAGPSTPAGQEGSRVLDSAPTTTEPSSAELAAVQAVRDADESEQAAQERACQDEAPPGYDTATAASDAPVPTDEGRESGGRSS